MEYQFFENVDDVDGDFDGQFLYGLAVESTRRGAP
jgi:hypothetical protein